MDPLGGDAWGACSLGRRAQNLFARRRHSLQGGFGQGRAARARGVARAVQGSSSGGKASQEARAGLARASSSLRGPGLDPRARRRLSVLRRAYLLRGDLARWRALPHFDPRRRHRYTLGDGATRRAGVQRHGPADALALGSRAGTAVLLCRRPKRRSRAPLAPRARGRG